MTVRVFIGIPTVNRPALVRQTIASVLAQTYTDYRVVVSDNCSAPDAAESVRQHVEEIGDPRIEFVAQARNSGEYGQGRFFYTQSEPAEYFMILHDDDVLKPQYLERGLEALDAHRHIDAFVANPFLMNGDGAVSSRATRQYLADHGRSRARTGEFDALENFMLYGFLPISGTLFRRSALVRSGFADEHALGNYPFECDVLLRFGNTGALAWYQNEELLGFRFHDSSMRNYMGLMDNPRVVQGMLRLFSAYRFTGRCERRRLIMLSRLHRAQSVIDLRRRDSFASRRSLLAALRANIWSVKAWALTPFVMLIPGICSRFLNEPKTAPEAPAYTAN